MSYPLSLFLGLLLFAFPVWILRVKGARIVGFEQRAWPSGRNAALVVLDALRASAGTFLLVQALPQVVRVELLGRWQDAVFLGAAVTAGSLVQLFSWRDEDFAFAPLPFMVGVAAVASHPLVLGISLPLAIGSALAVRAWSPFFLGGGLGIAAVGLVVNEQDWRIGVMIGLAWCFPALSSVMAGLHLGWPKGASKVGD
jgi:hypothetical protein